MSVRKWLRGSRCVELLEEPDKNPAAHVSAEVAQSVEENVGGGVSQLRWGVVWDTHYYFFKKNLIKSHTGML